MAVRATWFFTDPGFSSGWTETLFSNDSVLQNVMTRAKAYAADRFKLLGNGQSIKAIRVSNDDVRGDSLLFRANQLYLNTGEASDNKVPDEQNVPDTPWQSILLRFESGADYHKSLFFRGIPDYIAINPPGPRIFADANYLKLWNKWVNGVLANQWGWLARKRIPDKTGQTIAPMVIANNLLSVVTSANHTLSVGDKIRFTKGNTTPKLVGVYTIYSVPTPESFQVKVNANEIKVIAFPMWQTVTSSVQIAGSIEIQGETSRKVGKSFGSRVGRSKRVARTA